MGQYSITNAQIGITVNSYGAELTSLKNVQTGQEYMWSGDPLFWARTSPVLFPIVGGVKNKQYRFEGKTYSMPNHGFARDMEFTLTSQTQEELWFSLSSDEETLKKYPFAFQLEIGYSISGRSVKVSWRVTNTNERTLHFSIGGHPAFLCPLKPEGRQTDCRIGFDAEKEVVSTVINEEGFVTGAKTVYPLNGGNLAVTEHLFDQDALVVENHQAQRVSLLDEEGKEYLKVEFSAPLFGIWSPPGKKAPFICIEPWYGRCDGVDFTGELQDKEWGNSIAAGSIFAADYSISI